MDERRRFPRYDCSFKVSYATNGIATIEGSTIAKDISRGGVRILVSRIVKKGHILRIKIFHPEKDEAVEVVGRVKWINEGLATYSPLIDAGVQFTRVKPDEVDQLLATVQ